MEINEQGASIDVTDNLSHIFEFDKVDEVTILHLIRPHQSISLLQRQAATHIWNITRCTKV